MTQFFVSGGQIIGVHRAFAAAAAAKSLQSCPTLGNPRDGSPPGSPVPGILQARTLEWAAISFSNAWKWRVKVKSLSHVQLLATPWTAAYQAPRSMGFFQARVLEWGAIAFSDRAFKAFKYWSMYVLCIKPLQGKQTIVKLNSLSFKIKTAVLKLQLTVVICLQRARSVGAHDLIPMCTGSGIWTSFFLLW